MGERGLNKTPSGQPPRENDIAKNYSNSVESITKPKKWQSMAPGGCFGPLKMRRNFINPRSFCWIFRLYSLVAARALILHIVLPRKASVPRRENHPIASPVLPRGDFSVEKSS